MEKANGLEHQYIIKNNKKLKLGYTTGSCAAASAKAATIMLLTGREVDNVELMTPKGILLKLKIQDIRMEQSWVCCAVEKDSGDDPDITNGILVYAKVSKNQEGIIFIDGGTGVGRVTKTGLEQPIGSAAINKVPRQMIQEAVREVCEENDYHGGIHVEIIIPEGVEIGKKTFNPKLGIEGGISILGTSGIVEPMSEAALIESIRIEVRMLAANRMKYLLVTPGNYGVNFSKEILSISITNAVKCSNYVGEVVDIAVEEGFQGILFISHIGKFIKVAGGIMNTHSRYADARMEIMTANAILAGASISTARNLLTCTTTDEAIGILTHAESAGQKGLLEKTMNFITEKIHYHLDHRAYGRLEVGVILFSNQYGLLGQTKNGEDLLRCLEHYTE